jgi:hypothetical protein
MWVNLGCVREIGETGAGGEAAVTHTKFVTQNFYKSVTVRTGV